MIRFVQRGLLMLFFGWLTQTAAIAQQYDFSASSGTFVPVTNGTALDAVEADEGSIVIPIGFTFNYFGASHTQVKVFSNGHLAFDLTAVSSFYHDISTESRKIVAPLWDDLQGVGGTASYSLTGTAGSRVLTIEWLNWRWDYFATETNISFQVKLYETSNTIQFVYRQEAGALSVGTGAAIGITGNTSGWFYSLNDASASPTLALNGKNTIVTRPTTGQIYTFAPNNTPVVAPTVAATNITIATQTATALTINWTNGNGAYRIVAMKQTNVAESPIVANNTSYVASSIFQNGDLLGTGWYCVYNGTGNSTQVTGLQSGLTYRIMVIEYNGLAGQQKYNTTASTNNPFNATTTLVAPGAPTSNAQLIHTNNTTITFDVTELSGTKRAIFIKATDAGTAPVVDNTTYTANTVFGSGTQVGTSGWFCVANATSLGWVTVTGLTPNTSYRIHVVDYNGPNGSQRYNTSPGTNNPIQTSTPPSTPGFNYTFAATAGTFQPISGTALDAIETDDALSGVIPIGFPFMLGGISYHNLIVSSNGFISFNPYVSAFGSGTSNDLSGSLARPAIAPLWDDLSGSGGEASYTTLGTAPNRKFIIQFLNWRWSYGASSAVVSFQIALEEQSQKISFTYRSEAGAAQSPSASIGLAFGETGKYISLNNTSTAPTASTISATNDIATKPATGQVYTFTPVPITQTITFNSVADKVFGNAPFTLTASASSGLPVSYQSSNPALASVSGNIVTINAAGGPVTITATQTGNGAYSAAPSVAQSFSIAKADQTITFTKPGDRTYGSESFSLTASSSSGLPVSFSSSNPSVASILGNTVTVLSPGTANITASQTGNTNYNAAPDVVQPFVVEKAAQTITFGLLPAKVKTDPAFALYATSTSGLAVTYSSSNTAVATIDGSTVTLVGPGTTNITASQPGNTNYHPAVEKVQLLTVKDTQTITFAELAEKTFGDNDFTLNATASSSLPIIYTSSNIGVATASGNTVHIVSAGTTTITASQDGNDVFAGATAVSRTLVVKKRDQTITFNTIADKTVGDAAFEVSAASSSNLPVNFSAALNKVSIAGKTVTILAAGKETITASQAGNPNYNAATPVAISFCINPPKPIISVATPTPSTFVLTSSVSTGNQWYRDGAAISGADGNTITAVESGSYTLIVTTDGCSSVASDAKVILITGLESRNSEVKAYPNPVDNELVIEFTGSLRQIPSMVKLFNVSGKQIESAHGTGKIQLNTAGYAPGNYLVVIESGNQITSGRILKK